MNEQEKQMTLLDEFEKYLEARREKWRFELVKGTCFGPAMISLKAHFIEVGDNLHALKDLKQKQGR